LQSFGQVQIKMSIKKILIHTMDVVAFIAAGSAFLFLAEARGHLLVQTIDLMAPATAMAWHFIAVWFRFWIKYRTQESGGDRYDMD